MEEAKAKIREKNAVSSFSNKFGKSNSEILTDELSKKTIGLVTLEDLKKCLSSLFFAPLFLSPPSCPLQPHSLCVCHCVAVFYHHFCSLSLHLLSYKSPFVGGWDAP